MCLLYSGSVVVVKYRDAAFCSTVIYAVVLSALLAFGILFPACVSHIARLVVSVSERLLRSVLTFILTGGVGGTPLFHCGAQCSSSSLEGLGVTWVVKTRSGTPWDRHWLQAGVPAGFYRDFRCQACAVSMLREEFWGAYVRRLDQYCQANVWLSLTRRGLPCWFTRAGLREF